MTCEVEKRDGLVHIRGEMTIYDAAAIQESLFAAIGGAGDCCIALDAVSELDTTGIQLLLMAQRVCASRGGSFSLSNPSAVVREALGLLNLNSLSTAANSEAAA